MRRLIFYVIITLKTIFEITKIPTRFIILRDSFLTKRRIKASCRKESPSWIHVEGIPCVISPTTISQMYKIPVHIASQTFLASTVFISANEHFVALSKLPNDDVLEESIVFNRSLLYIKTGCMRRLFFRRYIEGQLSLPVAVNEEISIDVRLCSMFGPEAILRWLHKEKTAAEALNLDVVDYEIRIENVSDFVALN